jgi:hypothetical protein
MVIHFRFRLGKKPWRYYEAKCWFDARKVASSHFQCEPGSLVWETITAERFRTAADRPTTDAYKLTWNGSDAGVRPNRALTIVRV